MLFNSLVFPCFFAIVYVIYLALQGQRRWQNALLLIASYVFYGWWDARFTLLLALSTGADFLLGRALGAMPRTDAYQGRRKRLLLSSLAINLSILGFFKYFNFFSTSTTALLRSFGMNADALTINVILPVGISFYTFQTLSYTIDIYRGRLEPTRDPLAFAVFVAFFPQLVAGPIERASHFLPQLLRVRKVKAADIEAGTALLVLGYLKKLVVADNMGPIVDRVFASGSNAVGLDVVLGVVAFALQIYGDFSGYSDIARGTARLMGFDLMVNFRLPYFAKSPSDFWRRWHISLSTWLRDYVYIPLGGNRSGRLNAYRNLTLTMWIGGLWHGAAWNYVLWGAYHGALLCVYRPFQSLSSTISRMPLAIRAATNLTGWAIMLCFTLYGWLIFRTSDVAQIGHLTSATSLASTATSSTTAFQMLSYALPLILLEIAQYAGNDLLVIARLPVLLRGCVYGTFLIWITVFAARQPMEFIYFQF